MLQQTRVETVIPYFRRFIEKFPTVEALANAPEEEVLKAWEGLGYYSRARNLQAAVREVGERYGGKVPDDKDEISSLKGVGPYTAGAILSIAYNKPEPAVDGNVMRVLSRFFLIEEDIAKTSTRVLMENLAKRLIPEGQAGDFNQALMELGATVCVPRSPHCLTCPVMEHCSARLMGMEESLPRKKKAKPPRIERRVVAFVRGLGERHGQFLIRQRPESGLLARMWELPHFAVPEELIPPGTLKTAQAGDAARGSQRNDSPRDGAERDAERDARLMRFLRERLAEEEGLAVEPERWVMNAEHTFSHLHWELSVYDCRFHPPRATPDAVLPSHCRWIRRDEWQQYAFPNVFIKVIREMMREATPDEEQG
jgi:A/G-specific adenine glycosylase